MSDEEHDKSPSRESSEEPAHLQLYFSTAMVKALLYTLIRNSVDMMLMFAMEGHTHLPCDGVHYKTARGSAGDSSRVRSFHEWIEQERWNSHTRRDIRKTIVECVVRAVMPRLDRLAEQMAWLPLTTEPIHLLTTLIHIFTRCPLPAMPPSQSSASRSASSPPPPPPPSPVNSPRGAVRKQPESRSFRRLNLPSIDSPLQAFASATDPASRCSHSRDEIQQIGIEIAKLNLQDIIESTQMTQRLCGHDPTRLANLFAESRTPAQPPTSPFPRPPSAATRPPMSHPHPAPRKSLPHPPPLTAKMSFPRPTPPTARDQPFSFQLSSIAQRLPPLRRPSPNAQTPTLRTPSPTVKRLLVSRPKRATRRLTLSRPLSPVARGTSISSSLSPISNPFKIFESPSESSFEQLKHNLDCQLGAQIFKSCKKDKCCEKKNSKKWNDSSQVENAFLELLSAISSSRSSSPDSWSSDSSMDSNKTWTYRYSYSNYQRFQPDALTAAAWAGQLDEVRALLDSGLHVDAVDSYGRTALRVASSAGHVDVVRFLLERGAQVDSRPQGNK